MKIIRPGDRCFSIINVSSLIMCSRCRIYGARISVIKVAERHLSLRVSSAATPIRDLERWKDNAATTRSPFDYDGVALSRALSRALLSPLDLSFLFLSFSPSPPPAYTVLSPPSGEILLHACTSSRLAQHGTIQPRDALWISLTRHPSDVDNTTTTVHDDIWASRLGECFLRNVSRTNVEMNKYTFIRSSW